tara:strand:+ start:482 stop:1150 length:669 start_codon:yes stop_codon:yes gene_type:complete
MDVSKKETNYSKIILAMHSTDKSFGFGLRELKKNNFREKFFIKDFDKDLSNNLIEDLSIFVKNHSSFESIERIVITVGPSNFNASRLIVTCSKSLSQQINCSLDSYSSFQIIAKRLIANKYNFNFKNNHTFWIINKLKKRGYIAGQYSIETNTFRPQEFMVKELIRPKLYKNLETDIIHYEANFNIKEELAELLNLSYLNHQNSISNPWEKVFPIYPISPVN